MQGITQDAETIALGDERAAEQATMALDALYIEYSKQANPANAAEVRAAINGLFQQMENPSGVQRRSLCRRAQANWRFIALNLQIAPCKFLAFLPGPGGSKVE